MKRYEALYFVQHLPRFFVGRLRPGRWSPRGTYCFLELQHLPTKIEKLIFTIINRRGWVRDRIELVDVMGPEVWCLQRRLKRRTLNFMIRNFPRVQRWRCDRLPVIIRFHRRLIVWNGTHRMFTARLLQRKLRARVLTIGARR